MKSRLPEPDAIDATPVAIDLAKDVFDPPSADGHGRIAERTQQSRAFPCQGAVTLASEFAPLP